MSRQQTRKFDCAAQMPPLRHSTPGEPFDIRDSDVVAWLIEQPEILQYLFDKVKGGKGQRALIEYHAESGMWVGVDR